MGTHSKIKMPPKLFKKITREYKRRYKLNPLEATRKRENVISRHCLGLILQDEFHMGATDISSLIGCDHANILYGNKKAEEQIAVRNAQYVKSLENWKRIFKRNDIEVSDTEDTTNTIKNRIVAVISDGITDSLILKEEVGDVLIDVLRTFAPEYVEED